MGKAIDAMGAQAGGALGKKKLGGRWWDSGLEEASRQRGGLRRRHVDVPPGCATRMIEAIVAKLISDVHTLHNYIYSATQVYMASNRAYASRGLMTFCSFGCS